MHATLSGHGAVNHPRAKHANAPAASGGANDDKGHQPFQSLMESLKQQHRRRKQRGKGVIAAHSKGKELNVKPKPTSRPATREQRDSVSHPVTSGGISLDLLGGALGASVSISGETLATLSQSGDECCAIPTPRKPKRRVRSNSDILETVSAQGAGVGMIQREGTNVRISQPEGAEVEGAEVGMLQPEGANVGMLQPEDELDTSGTNTPFPSIHGPNHQVPARDSNGHCRRGHNSETAASETRRNVVRDNVHAHVSTLMENLGKAVQIHVLDALLCNDNPVGHPPSARPMHTEFQRLMAQLRPSGGSVSLDPTDMTTGSCTGMEEVEALGSNGNLENRLGELVVHAVCYVISKFLQSQYLTKWTSLWPSGVCGPRNNKQRTGLVCKTGIAEGELEHERSLKVRAMLSLSILL
jgi:hypothetical protein